MKAVEYIEAYSEWGPWFLVIQGLFVALVALVPPLPAEFMVIGSGVLAAEGRLPMGGVFAATFVGCLMGDIGIFALFRYKFIRTLLRWKWGRGLHRKILHTSLHIGGVSTWFGLLLVYAMPFGRSAAMATAGMMKMSWSRLLGLAVIGAFLWSWWLIGLGYVPTVATDLPPWASTIAGIAIGTAVGGLIVFIGTRGRRV